MEKIQNVVRHVNQFMKLIDKMSVLPHELDTNYPNRIAIVEVKTYRFPLQPVGASKNMGGVMDSHVHWF